MINLSVIFLAFMIFLPDCNSKPKTKPDVIQCRHKADASAPAQSCECPE